LHISLPVSLLICICLLTLLNNYHDESSLLPLLPPLAILAAFGLPTMKRSTINAVDWFAVTIFTGVAALVWLFWLALQTGWPGQLAKQALIWAPGFEAQFNPYTFAIAIAVSIGWFRLVYWRITRRPQVLWRAVVLSGSGAILCWVLLMSLWLPLINQKVSYLTVATEIGKAIKTEENLAPRLMQPGTSCIESNIGPSQRASFAYFERLHFAGFLDQNCPCYYFRAVEKTR